VFDPLLAHQTQANVNFGCFNPMRDVVAPGFVAGALDYTAQSFGDPKSPYHNTSLINTTLFFAGGA
jgi:hypothetical protein